MLRCSRRQPSNRPPAAELFPGRQGRFRLSRVWRRASTTRRGSTNVTTSGHSILGASSGFGAACALELAKAGYGIFGVHMDLRGNMPKVQEVIDGIRAAGQEAVFFNMNAADEVKRGAALEAMKARLSQCQPPGAVHVVLHSLAFGTLRPFIAEAGEGIYQAADGHDPGRHGQQPGLLGAGPGGAGNAGRGRPGLCHDQRRLAPGDPVLWRGVGRQGRPGVPRPPVGLRAGAARASASTPSRPA